MSVSLMVLGRILTEFVLDFFYFPIWWYTAGAKRALLKCVGFLREANSYLAPGLWFKNIFVPMYGQYDWRGRLVSFFMRLVNTIGRTIGLLLWLVIVIILFFIWMIFPVLVVWRLLNVL
jgi:hypothetical protein